MREYLALLPKPSRYTGIEEGAIRKDIQSVALHCALAFPDLYEIGMSYLGQKILYTQLNARDDVYAERVFAPCREAGAILRAHGLPLASLESDTPLGQMHLVGFSITHELCYTNVLYMLDLAGIPLRSAARGTGLDVPVIIAGGGNTLSAEPLAPFMDLMILGDGECTLPAVLELLITAREAGWTRQHFLEEARHIPGVYVPAFFVESPMDKNSIAEAGTVRSSVQPVFADYPHVLRRIVTTLDEAPYPLDQVVPLGAVHNRLSLEIARGCTRGCRFCQAGIIYRPSRERTLPELTKILEDCLHRTGYDEVSFLSLSTGDFSGLKHLFLHTFDRCAAEHVSVSLPSLRVGSIDPQVMEKIASIRRTGATLAPEAGSQRLRDVINKGITEEALLDHARTLMAHGWQQVKLYFMIGLPTETQEDLDAIVELCRKVRDAGGRGTPRLQVSAALSPFVPKPHTAFQWERQLSLEECTERIRYMRNAFKGQKFLKMRWHEPVMSFLEGILSRADRRLADVLESAYHKGSLFNSWLEDFDISPWLEALHEHGLTPAEFLAARPTNSPLPWAHLHTGVRDDFLLSERLRAFEQKTTADCRYAACRQCGVCDTKGQASLLRVAGETQAYHNTLNFPQRDQNEASLSDEEFAARMEQLLPPKPSAEHPAARRRPQPIAPEMAFKAETVRVWHSKTGMAAYLSQLEIQSVLERAMRQARLPLAFSQGFHPIPIFSFGRALPVGVASHAEWFSITLREKMPTEKIRAALAPYMPMGLEILSVESFAPRSKMPQAVREYFQLQPLGTPDLVKKMLQAWKNFEQSSEFFWEREGKKGTQKINIRPFFEHVTIDGHTVNLTMSWKENYYSPLALAMAVFPLALNELALTKIKQDF